MVQRPRCRGLDHFGDCAEEFFGLILPFGIERIGDDAGRDVAGRLISAADGHHRDERKAAAHH